MFTELKMLLLGTGGFFSLVLASVPPDAASNAYWIAEKFGFLGLVVFGIAFASWFLLPKIADKLFVHLNRLEDRNEASRRDFLMELKYERESREKTAEAVKHMLEAHKTDTVDAIRQQTQTLVTELRKP